MRRPSRGAAVALGITVALGAGLAYLAFVPPHQALATRTPFPRLPAADNAWEDYALAVADIGSPPRPAAVAALAPTARETAAP